MENKGAINKGGQAVILDFDGVLVNSVKIKNSAFIETARSFSAEIAQKLASELNGSLIGCDRHAIANWIGHQTQGRTPPQTFLSHFENEFSHKLADLPVDKGIDELFRFTHQFSILLFIVSNAPREDIIKILKNSQVCADFFQEILGYEPQSKSQRILRLIQQHRLNKNYTCYIGDMPTDLKAASESGVPFIKFGNDATHLNWPTQDPFPSALNIPDLIQIVRAIFQIG